MTSSKGLRLALLLSMAVSVAACGSTPSVSKAAKAGDELRDTNMDLVFATEFPVTNKADAMNRATEAWSTGDINRALFFYVRALQFDSEDVELLATIGKIHDSQNRPEMAVRAFSMALRIDPDHADSLEGRGLIFLAHDRDEVAEADLQRVVKIAPTAWRAQNGLGMLADRRGDHLIATMHYDAALAIVPESRLQQRFGGSAHRRRPARLRTCVDEPRRRIFATGQVYPGGRHVSACAEPGRDLQQGSRGGYGQQ
jgi:Flp pilus assembly protein TadD